MSAATVNAIHSTNIGFGEQGALRKKQNRFFLNVMPSVALGCWSITGNTVPAGAYRMFSEKMN